MLDLRQLHVLRAVAREGSLAGAARSLHYGHPTVTHHLDALESHLGARLVQRGPRGAVLTDVGELFLAHVEGVLQQIETAENEVRLRKKHGMATLRVGTFATAGARLLPRAFAQVADDGLRLELVEAEPLELVEQLRRRGLHCALVFGLDAVADDPSERDLVVHRLCEDPYRLILRRDHPLAASELVDLADLADEGWILGHSPYDPGDRALFAACEPLGFRPRAVLHTDDYGLMHGFVGAGAGLALVPELAIERRPDVAVRSAVQHLGSRCIQIAWLADRETPVLPRLRDALRRQAGGLAGRITRSG